MRKIPVFEIVCAGAAVFIVAQWFKTGGNVLHALVFWGLLLALLLSARFQCRFTGWIQLAVVLVVLTNNTIAWRNGDLSSLQYVALTVLFLGCVGWMQLARIADEDQQTEEEFEQGAGRAEKSSGRWNGGDTP